MSMQTRGSAQFFWRCEKTTALQIQNHGAASMDKYEGLGLQPFVKSAIIRPVA
jgi:hypothetical protein